MRALGMGALMLVTAQALYWLAVVVDDLDDEMSAPELITGLLAYFLWFPLSTIGFVLIVGSLGALTWRWLRARRSPS